MVEDPNAVGHLDVVVDLDAVGDPTAVDKDFVVVFEVMNLTAMEQAKKIT